MKHAVPTLALWAAACAAVLANAQTITLSYTPADAQYSAALDRIVMVSANPNQLHIYDPLTQSDTVVGLPKPPNAVSVSPDGLFAAVAHDALISYVNLSAASLQQTYTITFDAPSVVLGESWIYVLPGYSGSGLSIDIATGAVTTNNSAYSATGGRLNLATGTIYATYDGEYPQPLFEYDVSTGPITGTINSPYFDEYPFCGPSVWLSSDGSLVYSGCGTVVHASTNSALDLRYAGSFAGVPTVGAFGQSSALALVATVQSPLYYDNNDGIVTLSDSTYLQPIGQFILPGFTSGGASVTSHGRWVFFNNAGTDLFVLMQGENNSGGDDGFAIQVYSMAPPTACGAAFASSSASAIAAGTLATVGVTAADTCTYQAVSNASWLQIVSDGYASGNGTLTYLVRPNTGVSQRTGTISMAGQDLTVTQAGASASTGFQRLAYTIGAAAYDNALNAIVFATTTPNELHIYNPATQADTFVPLSLVPLSLSVRPDGAYAAVGHDGYVSYVNLQTGAVQNLMPVTTDAAGVVLAGNGYLYIFPRIDENLYSIQLSTGTQTAIQQYYGQEGLAWLSPDDQSIYETSEFGFAKWSILAGPLSPIALQDAPSSCGNFWLAADGSSIYTECGTAYSLSENEAQDFIYQGAFADSGDLVWAVESPAQQSIALIPQTSYNLPANDTQLQVYGEEYLGYAGSLALPQFMVGGNPYAGHGKMGFWNSAGTSLYVIEQADSTANLLSSFAVDTISPSSSSGGCTFTLGSTTASEEPALGFDSVSVTTGADCVWTASSNASWLTITAGSFAFGSGNLAFSFTENTSTSPRIGTMTIAGQTFTVTQAAAIFTISGQITQAGVGLSGVAVRLSSGATTTTGSSGSYSFGNLALAGNYTVTPELDGHIFSPPSATFQGLSANETADFLSFIEYDFNGGPGPDVIWQSATSGWAQIWYLGGPQGVTVTNAANLTESNPWRIVGVGDFNGDGAPDVVWQDPVHGAVQIWYLGGPLGNQFMSAANITTSNSWQVVSVADFNQDGHPDLLWEDPKSGWAQIWYLGGPQGTTLLGAANLTLSNPWHIVGTADFNGDGTPDVLWQDPVSGTVQLWYLGGNTAGAQGSQFLSAVNLTGAMTTKVVAVADFNQDGHPDVVFQDPVTGAATVYYYTGAQGTTPDGTAVLSSGNPWYIAGPH